jgi:hypothetical protein
MGYVIQSSPDELRAKSERDVLIYCIGENDPNIYYQTNVVITTPITKRLHYGTPFGIKWSEFRERDPAVVFFDKVLADKYSIEEYATFLHNIYYNSYIVKEDPIYDYIISSFSLEGDNDRVVLMFIMNFCCFIRKSTVKSAKKRCII